MGQQRRAARIAQTVRRLTRRLYARNAVRLSFTLLFCAVAALADPASAGELGGTGLVLSKVLLEYDVAMIQATGFRNPGGCQISSVAVLPNDAATRAQFVSLALTALSTGLKVEIWVEGCRQAPWGTAPAIYHMSLSR